MTGRRSGRATMSWPQLGLLPELPLDHWPQAAVNRFAIGRACVALGLLQFRRKRFAPPILRKITRFIS
jgi:hypothetical protein